MHSDELWGVNGTEGMGALALGDWASTRETDPRVSGKGISL